MHLSLCVLRRRSSLTRPRARPSQEPPEQLIFPVNRRELTTVPGVSPPVHYHSLLADVLEVSARYREVVVFHSERVYPEYVMAYQRFDGQQGPL